MKFLKSVRKEMKQVKWPEKKYMVKYSLVTILLVLFMGLYFYGIDAIMALIKGLR